MASIRQFAGDTVIYGLGNILSKVVHLLIVTSLLTYLLGEEQQFEYGIYSVLYSYMAILIVLFSFKMDTVLFRFGNKKKELKKAFDSTMSIVVLSALFIICLVLLYAEEIATLIDLKGNGYYIKWFGFILAADIICMVAYAKMRLENKAKAFALFKICNALLNSLIIVFFLFIFPKYNDTLFSWLPQYEYTVDYLFLTNLFVSVLFLIIALYYIGGFQFSLSKSFLKRVIPYALPLVVVGVANNFILYFSPALIKIFSSGQEVEQWNNSAVYESSRKIAGLLILFIGAFNYAAEPFFFSNAKPEDRKKLYGKICSLFVVTAGLLSVGLVSFLDITQYLVGEAFRSSLFIIPILLVAYILNGIYINISIWYKLSDQTIYGAFISIVGAIVTFIIIYFTLSTSGYVVCAWASVVTYFCMTVLVYLIGQKKYPIYYPIGKIGLSLLVIIGFLFLGLYINKQYSGISLYLLSIISVASYAIYAYLIEKESWQEVLNLRRSN